MNLRPPPPPNLVSDLAGNTFSLDTKVNLTIGILTTILGAMNCFLTWASLRHAHAQRHQGHLDEDSLRSLTPNRPSSDFDIEDLEYEVSLKIGRHPQGSGTDKSDGEKTAFWRLSGRIVA
ncbi:hypothetical protein B0J14DRAFT_566042 [Halenospora varia]|nr:hypothetical protein B0J14DRAFT_566042 [Halenospora varia]